MGKDVCGTLVFLKPYCRTDGLNVILLVSQIEITRASNFLSILSLHMFPVASVGSLTAYPSFL